MAAEIVRACPTLRERSMHPCALESRALQSAAARAAAGQGGESSADERLARPRSCRDPQASLRSRGSRHPGNPFIMSHTRPALACLILSITAFSVLAQPASSSSSDAAITNASGLRRGGLAGAGGARLGGRGVGGNRPARFQPSADFSAVIIGSGAPLYDPQRSGPCTAIQYKGRYVLVDMGNGTQGQLSAAGIAPAQIDAFFLTHHHIDHDQEFVPMLDDALVSGRRPAIVGPPGTQRLADFTADYYAEDIAYRIRRFGLNPQNLQPPKARELLGGETFTLGDVQISTAHVPHTIYTVAYRFDVEGQSIVVSGDLLYSTNLIALARDADVLIMDATASVRRSGARRGARGAAADGGPRDIAHASLLEVRQMAAESGVKKLVLTHILPGAVDEQATIQAINESFKGEVIVGRDLLEVVPNKP
jgi:ribonuclease BN (tRNA processing enzyme)